MALIIKNNTDFNSFDAVLDFANSIIVNTFVLNNSIGVVSITTSSTPGQFEINLNTNWIDQRTFIPNIVAPNNVDPITDVYFICWNRAFSSSSTLIFDILDKNGNRVTNLDITGIAIEIRIYNSQTTL